MNRSSSRTAAALAACLSLALLASCGGDDTEVLECTGTCTCDEDTRECSCEGGSDCAVEGADGVTFPCDGNARCDLSCGEDCVIECPGTSGCTATCKPTRKSTDCHFAPSDVLC